ncbi:unnamed protein product [Trichobilharzia regenti]|nr:unnamed protein product [Trichobilharzia regenti]
MNLTPESIVINRFGIWKLGGFEFSQAISSNPDGKQSEESIVRIPPWQSNLMPNCQLSLNASSPEAILQVSKVKVFKTLFVYFFVASIV